MAHQIILSVQNTPSQSLANVEREEHMSMECSYEVNHQDSPEEAGRKAGKRIAKMLRQAGFNQHDEHKED